MTNGEPVNEAGGELGVTGASDGAPGTPGVLLVNAIGPAVAQ